MNVPDDVWTALSHLLVAIVAWVVPFPRNKGRRDRHDD